jgi:hypothetical protein
MDCCKLPDGRNTFLNEHLCRYGGVGINLIVEVNRGFRRKADGLFAKPILASHAANRNVATPV